MLRLRTVLRLVLATLMIPLMLFGVSAAEAQPHAKAVSNESLGAADLPPGTPGPFKIVNQWSGACLDYGNHDGGELYLGVCNSSDPGQRWGWFNGGWLINLSDNGCAWENLDSQYPVAITDCHDIDRQHWRHQNYAIVNGETGHCMEPGTNSPGVWVKALPCRTTNHQGWYVVY